MVQLILTNEEKVAPSYLDWPDEDLGKLVKATALVIAENLDGKPSVFITAASLLLIKYVADCGETHSTVYQKGVTLGPTRQQVGDWEITIKKVN